jgi:hypothetical protein
VCVCVCVCVCACVRACVRGLYGYACLVHARSPRLFGFPLAGQDGSDRGLLSL